MEGLINLHSVFPYTGGGACCCSEQGPHPALLLSVVVIVIQKKLEQLLLKFPPEEVESKRWQKIADALGNRTTKQVTDSPSHPVGKSL